MLPIFKLVAKIARRLIEGYSLLDVLLGEAESNWALTEPHVLLSPAEKSRTEHRLSGIEKVKRIAVRLDEAAFACLQLG